jgi:hypothetical protein
MSESIALRAAQLKIYSGIDPSYTPPATCEIGLFSVAPNSDLVGGTELTGGGYSRPSMSNDATTWGVTNVTLSNIAVIGFVAPSGAWADAVSWVAFDPRDGSRMFGGPLDDAPISFAIGVAPSFAIGTLTHTKLS